MKKIYKEQAIVTIEEIQKIFNNLLKNKKWQEQGNFLKKFTIKGIYDKKVNK